MTAKNHGVEVRDLCKMFEIGGVQACKYVNLEIAEGEFMVLLGPSGCGKTTTLRCIAGLEKPDNDDAIWIKGRNITTLPPKDRNLAFVFQDTMLFPHLTVRKNISFGLDMRRTLDKAAIDRRVQEASKLLHVEAMLDRKPSQLSGGQAQRVALGRAIVMEPDAFLMDEPLANLDAALRVEMRTEIKRVQRKLSTSTIFVTHDQEEALSLGDKIAVMHEGAVQQVGSPHEIYHDPANLFVGTFIGSPPLNLFEGTLRTEGSRTVVASALFHLTVPDGIMKKKPQGDRNVRLGIRPEFVTIGPEEEDAFPVQVTLIEPLGSRTLIFLQAEGQEIRSMVQGESPVREGETVHVTLQMGRAFLFDPAGERV
ncbi:MAG: ABC transporter ATP-binding protein [Desulfobacterales bacterium]|nr:MAG: ABC transporter ATP-binding protein [Desulfobacterales bacterium]